MLLQKIKKLNCLIKRYGVTGVCIFTGGAYSVDLTLINDLTIDVMHVALN